MEIAHIGCGKTIASFLSSKQTSGKLLVLSESKEKLDFDVVPEQKDIDRHLFGLLFKDKDNLERFIDFLNAEYSMWNEQESKKDDN